MLPFVDLLDSLTLRRLIRSCFSGFSISVHERFFTGLEGGGVWCTRSGFVIPMTWSFGNMWIRGSPVIWHKQPFGKDIKIDVSVRIWIIASSPILHNQVKHRAQKRLNSTNLPTEQCFPFWRIENIDDSVYEVVGYSDTSHSGPTMVTFMLCL